MKSKTTDNGGPKTIAPSEPEMLETGALEAAVDQGAVVEAETIGTGVVAAQAIEPSRRGFLKGAATAGAIGALYWYGPKLMFNGKALAEPIPGGTLLPADVQKFVAELVKPPEMPSRRRGRGDFDDDDDDDNDRRHFDDDDDDDNDRRRHFDDDDDDDRRDFHKGQRGRFYKIAERQFDQQILPARQTLLSGSAGFPTTPVWSYGSVLRKKHEGTVAEGGTFFYPAFTIEAKANRETVVEWRNELVDRRGKFLPHLFAVDPTLHWANPPGGKAGRDTTPTFTDGTPGPYTGPVPMIVHVHGAHAREQFDGYPEAWYLPRARNIPRRFARTGTFFDHYKDKHDQSTWRPGQATFKYDNDQPATTLWYHDHTLGMTRLNVYAGPAGFWLIRGGDHDADLGFKAPTVTSGPFDRDITEIPIAIQDRSFNADASLFYPDNRAFFEGLAAEGTNGGQGELQIPFIGAEACDGENSDIPPIWNPEFFGNMMVVNGQTWPYLDVERRRYRFRLLNGCNSRFLILKTDNADVPFWQIGADQSFLPKPELLTELVMAPAERADVIMDFSAIADGTEITLINLGPDEPFGGGIPEVDFDPADPDSTGVVMRFRVMGAAPVAYDHSFDPASDPTPWSLPAVLGAESLTRLLSLNEESSLTVKVPIVPGSEDFALDTGGNLILDCDALLTGEIDVFGPKAALLGRLATGPQLWGEEISENPYLDDIEIWELHNLTVDAHPIHVHLVKFEVLGREVIGGGTSIAGQNSPLPWETGFKDTVIAYPGEITTIRSQFDLEGLYVWHCHIVEHEDNEMMRPYRVGPEDMTKPHKRRRHRRLGKFLKRRHIRRWKIGKKNDRHDD